MSYSKGSARLNPRFAGIKTFFRCPQYQEDLKADALILGVPFDGGSTYRSGSRMAPSRIREISSLGRGFHMTSQQDLFQTLKVCDGGDAPVNPISLQKTYQALEAFYQPLFKTNKKILSVGGDHSITLPLLRAAHKTYGKLNLVHFDAHYDTYPAAYGDEDYHHGTFVRHAIEEGLLNCVFQFGIRGPLTSAQDMDFIKKHQDKIKVFTMDDIKSSSFQQSLPQIFSQLKTPTYLSFDVDCLDPAFAPGTGTPLPGGLSSYEAQQVLRQLKIPKLIGADVVEVSPAYDHGDITSVVAVAMMFEILNLMAG